MTSAKQRQGDGGAVGDMATAARGIAEDAHDRFRLVGTMRAVLRGPDGEVKGERFEENLIVTAGRDAIVARLAATPGTAVPTHMAVGTGAVAPVAGNTALGAEIDRNALSSCTASGGVLTSIANWTAGDATNAAITEAGIFSASTGGTMFSRATFAAINKGANDTLQVTWTWTLTPS